MSLTKPKDQNTEVKIEVTQSPGMTLKELLAKRLRIPSGWVTSTLARWRDGGALGSPSSYETVDEKRVNRAPRTKQELKEFERLAKKRLKRFQAKK